MRTPVAAGFVRDEAELTEFSEKRRRRVRTEDKFSVTDIRRCRGSDNPKLGEDKLLQELSGFSCPKNPDVEQKSTVTIQNQDQDYCFSERM